MSFEVQAGGHFTQACEEALALSALPERLRATASVYVLTENGYQKTITGTGQFTCIVERNHADSSLPQCMDANGVEALLPAIQFRTAQVFNGASSEQIRSGFADRARDGIFVPPSGHGISYMMSEHNHAFINAQAGIQKIPPHVMFYAPNLNNDNIGGSQADAMANHGVPFIITPGIHGYMVSFVEHAAESQQVAQDCAGQLPAG